VGANGAALCLGQLRALQPQTAKRAQQDVGKGAEVEADLVGAQELGAGRVGEQIELLLKM